jgi:hypothetical protein
VTHQEVGTSRRGVLPLNSHPSTFFMTNSYTLRAGDLVEYAGQPCRVIKVSESAAVVEVIQKPRTITPRFGKPVTFRPSPKLERISPNSEIPILNR